MGVFAIDLGAVTSALAPTSETIGLVQFFGDAAGRRIVFDVLAYSCAAGLFVVPIFAAVQSWAGEDRRARVIGAVNTLNSIYMVAGSLATTLLLKLAGLSESGAMVLLGVANFVAAIYLFRRLPADFLVFALRTLWRIFLRLEVVGFDAASPRRLAQHRRHQSHLVARRARSSCRCWTTDRCWSSTRRWRGAGGSASS